MSTRAAAIVQLQKEMKRIQENPCEYFSAGFVDDDVFRWRVTIIGADGTLYQGGYFPTELIFPEDFPQNPPKMRFLCPMWHPNIGKDGTVCISILHKPGKDEHEYEQQSERWLPVHTVESIVISVLSMLSDPNPESPLNVEANRDFMRDKEEYRRKVRNCVNKSVEYC